MGISQNGFLLRARRILLQPATRLLLRRILLQPAPGILLRPTGWRTRKVQQRKQRLLVQGRWSDRVVKALNGLRTLVDDYVTKNPHPANDIQGQALSNVVTIQVVREVIKKFIKNIDPDEFFKNGGNEESLATLLAKECQRILSPAVDYRAAWQEDGSAAKKAMDQVTNEIVPFMVSWQAKQPFHKPNDVQDAACMKVVASRLCEEAFYEWA